VVAEGQGTVVVFFQPDDDCGSDTSISDPPAKGTVAHKVCKRISGIMAIDTAVSA